MTLDVVDLGTGQNETKRLRDYARGTHFRVAHHEKLH